MRLRPRTSSQASKSTAARAASSRRALVFSKASRRSPKAAGGVGNEKRSVKAMQGLSRSGAADRCPAVSAPDPGCCRRVQARAAGAVRGRSARRQSDSMSACAATPAFDPCLGADLRLVHLDEALVVVDKPRRPAVGARPGCPHTPTASSRAGAGPLGLRRPRGAPAGQEHLGADGVWPVAPRCTGRSRRAFAERQVDKAYTALVAGRWAADAGAPGRLDRPAFAGRLAAPSTPEGRSSDRQALGDSLAPPRGVRRATVTLTCPAPD